MAEGSEWQSHQKENSTDYDFKFCEKRHVRLPEMKQTMDLLNHTKYLGKPDIPNYPEYIFEDANVCHVTELGGLEGILNEGGFKRVDKDFYMWWNLSPPKQCQNTNRFPEEFATSPAFQTESLYGNFRFTFPFRELLREYSNIYRSRPILRVFHTKVYKKEIVYTILVHPEYMRHYRKYPRLPIDAEQVCGYNIYEKKIVWRCQSPSASYKYGIWKDAEDGQEYVRELPNEKYFVWDNVAVIFHMKPGRVLKFGPRKLLEHLTVCETLSDKLLKEQKISLEKAEAEVRRLKQKYNFE